MTAADDYADWEYYREKADYDGPYDDLDDEDDPDELDS